MGRRQDAYDALLAALSAVTGGPSEPLCVVNEQKTFSGRMWGIVTTDEALWLVPLSRKLQPEGEARRAVPSDIRAASVDGAGGGWITASMVLADMTSIALRLEFTDGEKHKFLMTRDTGLGAALGGTTQTEGVAALLTWLERARPEAS
ncbi:MAG: hypothetical protein U0W40_17790 [Acidimicrobiia bacterium]